MLQMSIEAGVILISSNRQRHISGKTTRKEVGRHFLEHECTISFSLLLLRLSAFYQINMYYYGQTILDNLPSYGIILVYLLLRLSFDFYFVFLSLFVRQSHYRWFRNHDYLLAKFKGSPKRVQLKITIAVTVTFCRTPGVESFQKTRDCEKLKRSSWRLWKSEAQVQKKWAQESLLIPSFFTF